MADILPIGVEVASPLAIVTFLFEVKMTSG
jgi:hypothetical protein